MAEDQVKRIIRYGVSCRIFQEPKKGFVAHTAASKLMKDDPIISDTIGMFADELWPASTRIADAISKWVILVSPIILYVYLSGSEMTYAAHH